MCGELYRQAGMPAIRIVYDVQMLLMLGGLIGSGRKMLAQQIALAHNFHPYDARRYSIKQFYVDPRGRRVERAQSSNSDEERMALFTRIAGDVPMLSKLHEKVIMERSFHRKAPREFLIEKARSYFDPVVFVWVRTDEETADAFIREMFAKGMIESIEGAHAERKKNMDEFDGLLDNDLSFDVRPGKTGEEAMIELWNLIQEHVRAQ